MAIVLLMNPVLMMKPLLLLIQIIEAVFKKISCFFRTLMGACQTITAYITEFNDFAFFGNATTNGVCAGKRVRAVIIHFHHSNRERLMGFGPTIAIHGTMQNAKLLVTSSVNVKTGYGEHLRNFKILSANGMKIWITGLGPFNWAVNAAIRAETYMFKYRITRVLEKKLEMHFAKARLRNNLVRKRAVKTATKSINKPVITTELTTNPSRPVLTEETTITRDFITNPNVTEEPTTKSVIMEEPIKTLIAEELTTVLVGTDTTTEPLITEKPNTDLRQEMTELEIPEKPTTQIKEDLTAETITELPIAELVINEDRHAEPAAEHPAAEPVINEESTAESTTEQPAAQPVINEDSTAESTTEQPAAEPVINEESTAESTEQPAAESVVNMEPPAELATEHSTAEPVMEVPVIFANGFKAIMRMKPTVGIENTHDSITEQDIYVTRSITQELTTTEPENVSRSRMRSSRWSRLPRTTSQSSKMCRISLTESP